MALDGDYTLSESPSSIGGWFGDILEGVKGPAIDAMGYRIRQSSGMYAGLQQPVPPAPVAPGPEQQQPRGFSTSDMVAVGGLILLAGGAFWFMGRSK